ncbi:substrate-binding domain-containing protein [Salmonella enterica]|nr:hypothetical protein [Salmonella enterica]
MFASQYVITTNDTDYEIRVRQCLHEISIPADTAVIGFNDTVLCQYLDPELSTIRIPADMIGNLAVSMLINKTQDSPSVVNSFLIDLMYIERESTI